MPSKSTSSTRLITTKKQTLQSSKEQIMYKSYSRNWIINGVKFHLQNFVGLARTLLKNYYQLTIIWYAKLASTRRKCFTGWECVNSHPANHQLTYESSHKNTNPILKWALITTICMQESGSVTISSQFLTPRTIMQCHPIHQKFQYSLIFQRRKWATRQELQRGVPQKIFLIQTKSMTSQIRIHTWNPMWSQARNNWKIVRATPAFPNTTYIITRSLIARTTIDNSLSAELVCSTERARRRSGKFKERATWHIRDISNFSHTLFCLFHGDSLTCYSVWTTSKTQPLILNSSIFYSSLHRPDSIYPLFLIFSFVWTI